MLLKLLFLAIVFYLVLKVARNLIRAVLVDPRSPAQVPPTPPPPAERPRATRRTTTGRDIEDARWTDL